MRFHPSGGPPISNSLHETTMIQLEGFEAKSRRWTWPVLHRGQEKRHVVGANPRNRAEGSEGTPEFPLGRHEDAIKHAPSRIHLLICPSEASADAVNLLQPQVSYAVIEELHLGEINAVVGLSPGCRIRLKSPPTTTGRVEFEIFQWSSSRNDGGRQGHRRLQFPT